jgi:nuclear transport factor 2 (NTF2) superfamily protein
MSLGKKLVMIILLLLAGTSSAAYAEEEASGPMLALDRFSLKIMRFTCNKEMQTPDISCDDYLGRTAAEFDLSLLKYGFWRNEIHGEGTRAKFMTIGWHWELGIRLGSQVEVFWDHHSRHVMDREQPYYWSDTQQAWRQGSYPVEDSYGIRIIFYERK